MPRPHQTSHEPDVVIYGINAIDTLLRHDPKRVLRVLFSHRGAKGLKGARERLISSAEAQGVETASARERQLDHYAPDAQHQGVIAFIIPKELTSWSTLCRPSVHPLLLALDQVTDPRNFGAILRSAEAFGVGGALITSNRCARPGPTVTRTSAGLSELIPIAMETNLSSALREASAAGYRIIGAALGGGAVQSLDWEHPTVIVIGAEGRGLREKTRGLCDELVMIPMHGRAESLNASVAAGVLFYEATRLRSH